jgi:phosphate:Na+ symporter
MTLLTTVQLETGTTEIDVVVLLMTLFGGLALFLHGMDRMTEALKVVAGDRMRAILQRLTSNRLMAVATGAGVTAVIQSSSVTTVLVVGFVTSGLMSLTQAAGVIVGANVGTTITAQIIALDVTRYALALVAIGFGISFFGKREYARSRGTVVMGLGLIFFGMGVMGDALAPLRSHPGFTDLMVSLRAPLLGILVGAVFTALVQSSSATTALVIVLAGQGLIPLEAGIALILGANVGTSVTALLASLGKPRVALRAAVVHTVFNLGGVLIFAPLIPVLAAAVEAIGGGLARQIANAHTIFNVATTLLVLPVLPRFVALVEKIVRDRPEVIEQAIRSKYLDRELLRTPPLALDHARLELTRLAERVGRMIELSIPIVLEGSRDQLTDLEAMDDEVDILYGHIVQYLGLIGQQSLRESDAEELSGLMEATNALESIGDLIETNLVALGYARIDDGVSVSPGTKAMILEFHATVKRAFDGAMLAVTQRNREQAQRVQAMKGEVNSLERSAWAHEAERLVAPEPKRLEAYRFETDVLNHLKRIYYFCKRAARASVPASERSSQ